MVLDHYYVRLRNGCLAVVVGNFHGVGFIVGYVKYCPTNRLTLWCDRLTCYERIVKYYDVNEVYGSTQWRINIPCYGGEAPIIPRSHIVEILDPIERSREILVKPRDQLEEKALDIIGDVLVNTGVLAGVTGSILPMIHNPGYSDVDLVIYGVKNSLEVIEYVGENPEVFKRFTGEKLRTWCLRVASATGLSAHDVCRLYRSWRRGVYGGREYSIIYNDGVRGFIENSPRWDTVGVVEVKAEFLGSVDALNYPTKGVVGEWVYLDGVNPSSDIDHVLSFEALYMPLFYEGGWGVVRGLLQHDPVNDIYRVLVGVRETRSYVKPL